MNSLLMLGAGSFAVEVDELARLLGYDDIAYLDDNPSSAYCKPVVGSISDIEKMREKYDTAIVALGNNETRLRLHTMLKENNYTIPTLIHPTAYISPDATIGAGTIVRARDVISRYVKIGEACIINAGALIDHHVIVEDGCHILMGTVVRNMTTVKSGTRIPSNAVVE